MQTQANYQFQPFDHSGNQVRFHWDIQYFEQADEFTQEITAGWKAQEAICLSTDPDETISLVLAKENCPAETVNELLLLWNTYKQSKDFMEFYTLGETMFYAFVENGVIVKRGTAEELWPGTNFYPQPSPSYLLEKGAVAAKTYILHDSSTHKLVQCEPYILDGLVYSVQVEELSAEDIEATKQEKRKQMKCNMRQARLALLQAGKLSVIDAAIASLDEPLKSQAAIEWQYASNIERLSPLVQALTPVIGLSPDELDELFTQAVNL